MTQGKKYYKYCSCADQHNLLVLSVELLMMMMAHTSSLVDTTPRQLSVNTVRVDGRKIFPASILGDPAMVAELI